MTRRIVIELRDGDVQGIYTDFSDDLEVRVIKQEDELLPVDVIIALNERSTDVEVTDPVDVSFDPRLVNGVFAYEEGQ